MFFPRTIRTWHRLMGALLVLPFLAWAVTGFFFFIKPGYDGAYASIQPKVYPVDAPVRLEPRSDWLEIRLLRTVLGNHLLVRTRDGRLHLDADTLEPKPKPDAPSFRALIEEAILSEPQRYGSIASMTPEAATTTTGITITLRWETLSLYQYGPDTRRIDWMYKIHYLQWTGIKSLDRVLGVAGLSLVCLMTLTGIRLLTAGSPTPKPR